MLSRFRNNFSVYGKSNVFLYEETISSETANYNLNERLISNGWNGSQPIKAQITIEDGVTISSLSTGTPAFDIGITDPELVKEIVITNNGNIHGLGGNGGAGGVNASNGQPGGTGGPAFKTEIGITLNNLGAIRSGSGGQGGGAANRTGGTSGFVSASCVGGISCSSSPATCNKGFCNTNTGPTGAQGGSTGSTGLTGVAGVSRIYGNTNSCAAISCSGGSCDGRISCATGSPGAGGQPGACIIGNSYITYINTGTRQGPIT